MLVTSSHLVKLWWIWWQQIIRSLLEFVSTTVPTEETVQSWTAVDVILASMEVTVVRVSTWAADLLSKGVRFPSPNGLISTNWLLDYNIMSDVSFPTLHPEYQFSGYHCMLHMQYKRESEWRALDALGDGMNLLNISELTLHRLLKSQVL